MAKKQTTAKAKKDLSLIYWRELKREDLHEVWSNLAVTASVTKNPSDIRLAKMMKGKLNFIDFGMKEETDTRHLRPPIILFNKILTYRYLYNSKKGCNFAKPLTKIIT